MAWPVRDGASLELVTDKKSYEIGDVAKVLVKSPFKEAEAIVTVERQGIFDKRRISVKGPMATFSVPITNETWPNTFVSVELVKGRTAPVKDRGPDPAGPAYRIGWTELKANPEARRLKVDVKPSRTDFGPGDEVDVDLLVTDRAGRGARTDVAFYAVDEGVLVLTGYKTPDPLTTFAARRQLSVAAIESRDALASILRLAKGPAEDKGGEGGGGGDDGPGRARADFRSTAVFIPSVITGPDGKAHVKFKLPDGLTTYRLMAVASAEDDRFGFGESQVVTSRPLMARPALPRFLRAGDAMEAGIVLTTKGLGAQRVEVTLDAKGVVVTGDRKKVVDVPANGSVEVRWSIGAPAVGPASLTFTATSGKNRDVVTVSREVQVPLSLESVALYGDTATALAEKLGDLRAMRPDVGGLDLRMSSTALVGLDDGVEALLEYPYGCTEQLTSRLVPLVALVDLAKDYNVALPKDPNAAIDAAIAKVLGNQLANGGFGWWADSREADPFLTAYALWGLTQAKERGRPVPQEALDGAVAYLRREIEACGWGDKKPKPGRGKICENDDVFLAAHGFVADVLAETGHADAGLMSQLFEHRQKLPLFARAELAHAMVVAKMRLADAQELVRDVEAHLRLNGAGATVTEQNAEKYGSLLDSEARTTAMVLRTLVTIDPQHPLAGRLARGLLAMRRGGAWRTTQENAWALLALDAYRRAQEAKEPDFDGVAFLGEDELFRAAFHRRSVKGQSKMVPASKLTNGESLAFQVDGRAGRLFYEARLRYATKELPTTALDRGFFVRKLLRGLKPGALGDALRTTPQDSEASAAAGDLVLVDLLVVTPDPREQVVIDDPLPAGLEAVDTNLRTTARDLSVDPSEPEPDADEQAMGRSYRTSEFHREMHDDRVLTFVDSMAPGMYHYRYLARATTSGRFVTPPTRAECMYEPETFGRTAAAVFEVKK